MPAMTMLAKPLRLTCCGGAMAVLCLSAPVMSQPQGIWKWTDERGRIHYADVVPEKYRSVAKPVAPDTARPSAQERQAALARAAADKSRASSAVAPSPIPAAAPSTPATQRRPARGPDPDADCETWTRLYEESLECFGPFRTAHGATRPEAFEHCTPVDAPPSRCRQHFPQ